MIHKTLYVVMFLSTVIPTIVEGHDTTHIHPLITSKIAELIQQKDSISKNYGEIYAPIPDTDPIKLLYWGTDFAPAPGLNDDLDPYVETTKNTINGVVHEDVPVIKVLDHFYHATSGIGLTAPQLSGNPSSMVAMAHFNDAIDWYGKYTEEAKGTAFFEFGRALHHVEDNNSPAHIHNEVENTLFVPMLRYGQLKNTHVVASMLRFLNYPRLALKQTENFQTTNGQVEI